MIHHYFYKTLIVSSIFIIWNSCSSLFYSAFPSSLLLLPFVPLSRIFLHLLGKISPSIHSNKGQICPNFRNQDTFVQRKRKREGKGRGERVEGGGGEG